MKIIPVFLFHLVQAAYCIAQPCKENFFGTKTLYQPQQLVYTQPPPGYSPVFINHAGRHGARHLTKDVNSSFAYGLLLKADSLQALSEKGQHLKEMVLLLEKVEKKNNKSISFEGASEQKGIAERTYINNRDVFYSAPTIESVMVTKEIRTHQSAMAFLEGLKNEYKINNNTRLVVNDTVLRFYDLSPTYLHFEKEGDWQRPFNQLKETIKYDSIVQQISGRFFSSNFLNTIEEKDLSQFVSDISGFATIIPSIEKEITDAGYSKKDADFQSLFTCNELQVFSRIDAAEDYLLKGPGKDSLGIQIKIAAPLLDNFITTTDEFITNRKEPVVFRFAHAETISPLAALLDICDASTSSTLINGFEKSWKAEEIIPLSANIQWILYQKKGSDDYLVKILLNEKEVAIKGLSTPVFPFYSWSSLRKFYIERLAETGYQLHENMYQYLLKVK